MTLRPLAPLPLDPGDAAHFLATYPSDGLTWARPCPACGEPVTQQHAVAHFDLHWEA